MSNNVATIPKIERRSLLAKIAERYNVEAEKMLSTLKATAFKGDVSNEQMMALLIVADQHKLNPWTKEIYAFPDRQNGIVPVVGVDGWSRIVNDHPEFDGMKFDYDDHDESMTCTIWRKDRKHPVSVTEYLSECRRSTGPWGSHPKRMLRHKAMIQCARLAFGFSGIYDQDEAERIAEGPIDITPERPAADPLNEQLGLAQDEPEPVEGELIPSQPESEPDDEPLHTIESVCAAIKAAKTRTEWQQAGMLAQKLTGEDKEFALERYYQRKEEFIAKRKGGAD